MHLTQPKWDERTVDSFHGACHVGFGMEVSLVRLTRIVVAPVVALADVEDLSDTVVNALELTPFPSFTVSTFGLDDVVVAAALATTRAEEDGATIAAGWSFFLLRRRFIEFSRIAGSTLGRKTDRGSPSSNVWRARLKICSYEEDSMVMVKEWDGKPRLVLCQPLLSSSPCYG